MDHGIVMAVTEKGQVFFDHYLIWPFPQALKFLFFSNSSLTSMDSRKHFLTKTKVKLAPSESSKRKREKTS